MDVFALCAFQTPSDGAVDALSAILRAGMPANIRVGELNEESQYDPQAGMLHLICTYATPAQFELAEAFIDVLFEYGASWMLLDGANQTPGDIAWDMDKKPLYVKFVQAGVRSEILLQNVMEDSDSDDDNEEEAVAGNQQKFLAADLQYDDHTLQTSEQDGVMMDWETPIMKRSAEAITKVDSIVLNIGFGMGIIDTFIQELKPATHYIVEAHPAVLRRMKDEGWYEKSNVIVLEGSWKTVLPRLLDEGVQLDGIFYDTFSEHYKDMLTLFDLVCGLLSFEGVFSYFNGLGADRQVCYDVYKDMARYNLQDYGLAIDFELLPVKMRKDTWKGIKREYFKLQEYALPRVTFADQLGDEEEGDLVGN